jgi:cell wall-associated NlpC family hydrolase
LKTVRTLTLAGPYRLAAIVMLSVLALVAFHPATPAHADERFPVGTLAYVVLDDTEVYAEPDFTAAVVTRLAHGVAVMINGEPRTLESGVAWYPVNSNVGAGWLPGDDLAREPAAPPPPPTAVPVPPTAPPPPPENTPAPARSGEDRGSAEAAAAIAARVVDLAMAQRGARYRWGGITPAGFDCSGLVYYVFRQIGLGVPRSTIEQSNAGVRIPAAELRPGDLVYFKNTSRRGISHVAIYVGNGKILHAVSERVGVVVSELWSAYWAAHYAGSVRVIP